MTRSHPSAVVILGESIAGLTTARELRTRGYDGKLTMIGREPEGAYARPPLSKAVLRDPTAEATLAYPTDDLDLTHVRSAATAVDTSARVVTTAAGEAIGYDALVIATGTEARRLAAPGQDGELVLRTLQDARRVRERLDRARSAIVVGAGFLGLEVASACLDKGVETTIVDTEPPLRRLLGPFLSDNLARRATRHGLRIVQTTGTVRLAGQPVSGVRLPDGNVLNGDVVLTCAGDIPTLGWLAGTGLADRTGIAIDERCATSTQGVYAAGDVAYIRRGATSAAHRTPFWSNAVAQGKVAAASVLGQPTSQRPIDDYFWTEILGIAIKVAGPLPVEGAPVSVDGDLDEGDAILRWERPGVDRTVVAFGRKVHVGRLRALARGQSTWS